MFGIINFEIIMLMYCEVCVEIEYFGNVDVYWVGFCEYI